VAESEFNVSNNDGDLKLEDLVNSIKDTTNFGALKKQLSTLNKGKKPLREPLAAAIKNKIERKVAYRHTKKDITKWQTIVKKNREADTLQFPLEEPPKQTLSTAGMVSKFQPENEMEQEIAGVLRANGVDEKKIREFEELELSKLSAEEVAAKRQELARMRSLMFFQEQKHKRIKKIKSKLYHKLKNKAEKRKTDRELEELKKIDPELHKQLIEKTETERADERITQRHKNRSKWIKKALKHGTIHDPETRQAIAEQLKLNEILMKKNTRY